MQGVEEFDRKIIPRTLRRAIDEINEVKVGGKHLYYALPTCRCPGWSRSSRQPVLKLNASAWDCGESGYVDLRCREKDPPGVRSSREDQGLVRPINCAGEGITKDPRIANYASVFTEEESQTPVTGRLAVAPPAACSSRLMRS